MSTPPFLRKEDSGFGTTEYLGWQACIEPEGSISNESWTPHQPIADRHLYNLLYANKQDFKQTKSVGLILNIGAEKLASLLREKVNMS